MKVNLPLDSDVPMTTDQNGMNHPFSNDALFLARLKSIEEKINQRRLPEAAQELNVLGKTARGDPRLFLLGSRLAQAAGNPKGVLEGARMAHQLAPAWPVATIYLAEVLADQGEVEDALSAAEKAVQQALIGMPAQQRAELLGKAATIAHRLGLHARTLLWLREAERISPDDRAIRQKIARTLIESGQAGLAVEILSELLRELPGNASLLSDRLRACLVADQRAQAVEDGNALVSLEPDNQVHRFHLELALGLTPRTQPEPVICAFYDGCAALFDRDRVGRAQYRLPMQVAQMIHQWHPDRRADILDLGCGTGLLGANLGPKEGVLVGVDLSGAMLAQASRHGVYDRFHQVNVLDALRETPPALYHVIAALDVLIHVGALESVIPNAWRILLPGGRFVFSFETSGPEAAEYALQPDYHYVHQRGYVRRLLDEAGFAPIDMQDCTLRVEAGRPIAGVLVSAVKSLGTV